MDFTPNSQYAYSNTNTVLARVVEKVSGMTFDDYLRRHILGPAGLAQTVYPDNGWLPLPFANGYTKGDSHSTYDGRIVDAALWNPSWADAAGKMVSTVGDLSTWTRILGRGSMLRPATQKRQMRDGSVVVPGITYAFAIFDADGWLGHNGDIPGYATVAIYLPERDATLVVSTNSAVAQPHPSGQIAYDITRTATPNHVYELGPQPPLKAAG